MSAKRKYKNGANGVNHSPILKTELLEHADGKADACIEELGELGAQLIAIAAILKDKDTEDMFKDCKNLSECIERAREIYNRDH